MGWWQKRVANARATVWWNGIKVHDNAEVQKANGGIKVTSAPGGLKLQEHGQDDVIAMSGSSIRQGKNFRSGIPSPYE